MDMNNIKPITLPKLPVRGVWGTAYLTPRGMFKVTTFGYEEGKDEHQQPGQKYRAKRPKDIGYIILVAGVIGIIAHIGLAIKGTVVPFLLPIAIAVAALGFLWLIINYLRELMIPQEHAEINTAHPTAVDREMTDLILGLGYNNKYDPVKHARLFELTKNKRPID